MAKDELMQSEEQFQTLSTLAPVGIYLTKPDGNCIYTNPAWQKMAGLSEEEALGHGWVNGIHPDDREMVFSNWQKMVDSQGDWGYEYRFLTREGITTIVYGLATPQKDASGNIIGYIGVNVDITERKQANMMIEEIIDKNPVSIQILDKDGFTLKTNPAFKSLFGSEPPADYSIFNDLQLAQKGMGAIFDQLRNGEVVHFPDVSFNPHDSIPELPDVQNWIRTVGFSLNVNSENPEQFILMQENITEQKKTEITLRESELKFRQTFDVSPVGIVMVGLDTRFINCNLAFSQSLGYEADELIGKLIEDVTLPEDRHIGKAEMLAIVKGEILKSQVQKRYLRKDGQVMWGEVTISLIRDQKRQPQYFLAIIQNITERKQVETALLLSEEKFSKAFRISPDAININRLSDGRYLDINEGFTILTGYTQEDVKGKTSVEIDIWVDLQDRARLVKGLLESGRVENLEAQFRIKDGTIKTCLMSAQVIEIDNEKCILSLTRDITDRKMAELKLIESEDKFARVFNDAPVWIAISDMSTGKYLEINEEALRISGYSREEVIGHGSVEIGWITAEDRQRLMQEINDHGRITDMEMSFRTKNGKVIYGLVNGEEMMVNGISCLLTITADITEQKHEQEKVKESENNLKKAQHYAHIGSWSWKPLINRLEWSDEMFHIFGLERETFTGILEDVISKAIHPEDRAKVEESNLSVLKYGKPFPVEYRIIWPDGSIHTVWAEAGEMVKDVNGSIIQLNGTAQDITERKRAEQALSESEERYHLIDEASQDLIFSYDRQSRFTHANTSMCKLLGLNLDQIIGKTHEELGFPQEQCDEWEKLHQQVYDTNSTVISETKTPIQGGEPLYFEVVLNPIHDDSGAIIGIAGTTRDINARKQAEAKICNQLNELKRWHDITLGREDRIMELKREVNKLLVETGKQPQYPSVE